MPSKTVKLVDLAKELGKFGQISLKQQQRVVGRVLVDTIPKLVQNSPVDTGLYAQSWDFTIDEKKAVLGNYAPHASIIEDGARPFTPPLEPLLAWAKRVLRDPSQPPNYSPQVWKLARGTQQKIARVGIKPHHVLGNAIPGIIEEMKRELKAL